MTTYDSLRARVSELRSYALTYRDLCDSIRPVCNEVMSHEWSEEETCYS